MTLLAEKERRRLTLSLSHYTSDLIGAWATYSGEQATSLAMRLIDEALLARASKGSIPEPVLMHADKAANNRLSVQ